MRIQLRFLLCFPLLLTGCKTDDPPPADQVIERALPENTQVREAWSSLSGTGKVDDGWLMAFGDDQLEKLVAEVLANNRNLEAAAAQVDVAAGLAKQAGAALKPTVGLGASTSRTDPGGVATDLNSSSAFLSVSWELDLWGRMRAGASGAEATFRATEADYTYARQSLVAQAAKGWFLATQIYAQQELAKESVDIYTKLVELVETKQSMGVGARQDLPLAKANLFRARGNLRRVNSSYQEILRSLEVILGRYPSAELKAAPDFVAVPPPIPIGLPSEILERRPDMVAAENRVRAAFFGAREARAARLPSVSLSASAGADSALSDMLGAGNLATNLGASMFAPLYSGGALKAGVEIADAQQRAALAGYAQAALRAFQEVETALTNEQLLREQEGFLQEVVTESNEAYRITRTQYDSGEVDLLTVLQTQAGLLGSRSSLIAIRNERLAQRVDLHLALGGSFEPAGE